MTDVIEKMARSQREAWQRYRVEGTTDDEFGGPPYRAPWFLIDTSTAEPEVNWPGELVAEYDNGQDAHNHKDRLVARAALRAALEDMLPADDDSITNCVVIGWLGQYEKENLDE